MQPLYSERAYDTPAVTRIKAPGTCGELIQGALDNQDYLVNCPIDLYATAVVATRDVFGVHLDHSSRHHKVRDALALAEYEFGLQLSHEVRLISDIPRGKGMASSTADITAALAAVLRNCGVSLSVEVFARILTEVEPSDCVHFEGIAHVNHLTGDLFSSLPPPQGLRVLIVDCGGEVDTMAFDRDRARALYRENENQLREALHRLKQGLREGRLDWVAQAATSSAELSQRIHCKPQFSTLLELTQEVGALGVNCAHSGSVLGVLYRSAQQLGDSLRTHIDRAFANDLSVIGDFAVIGGGCFEH